MRHLLAPVLILCTCVSVLSTSALAEKSYSFEIVPGVSLGPLLLDMNVARAKTAMPEPVTQHESTATRQPDGTISSSDTLRWLRSKDEGPMLLVVAQFADGKIRYIVGDDDRFAFRGTNLNALTVARLIEALGIPDNFNPTGPGSLWVVWDAKGVTFSFIQREDGWKVDAVAVFPKGTYSSL